MLRRLAVVCCAVLRPDCRCLRPQVLRVAFVHMHRHTRLTSETDTAVLSTNHKPHQPPNSTPCQVCTHTQVPCTRDLWGIRPLPNHHTAPTAPHQLTTPPAATLLLLLRGWAARRGSPLPRWWAPSWRHHATLRGEPALRGWSTWHARGWPTWRGPAWEWGTHHACMCVYTCEHSRGQSVGGQGLMSGGPDACVCYIDCDRHMQAVPGVLC